MILDNHLVKYCGVLDLRTDETNVNDGLFYLNKVLKICKTFFFWLLYPLATE